LFLQTYLADTSSLINLVNARNAAVRINVLTRLLDGNRLKVPEAVAKEIAERDDKLKSWVTRHLRKCLKTTQENISDLVYVSRAYERYLLREDKKSPADPIIVCMARYYRQSGWVVLADDAGIQAVCLIEKMPFCTSQAFRMLEAV
jgi:hypothetical protein